MQFDGVTFFDCSRFLLEATKSSHSWCKMWLIYSCLKVTILYVTAHLNRMLYYKLLTSKKQPIKKIDSTEGYTCPMFIIPDFSEHLWHKSWEMGVLHRVYGRMKSGQPTCSSYATFLAS